MSFRDRFYAGPIRATPNLFVPCDHARYARLAARHEETGGASSRFDRRTFQDGVVRDGIWIPLGWWEKPGGARPEAPATSRAGPAHEILEEVPSGLPPDREKATSGQF